MRTIFAPTLFDGRRFHGPARLSVENGVIAAVETASEPRAGDDVVEGAHCITPGFVDAQVNGGGGALLNNDVSVEAVLAIVGAHRRAGTTSVLPTLITDERSKLRRLGELAGEIVAVPGVAGLHIEGPFINPERCGVHAPEHIRSPDKEDLELISHLASLAPLLITVAPEALAPEVVARFVAAGAVVSIGHSEISAEGAERAFADGARGVTHLFNAMPPMLSREPGLVGAVLAHESAYAGLIVDGVHVHPSVVRTALRALGPERAMLVSDAMATVGADESEFSLNGRIVRLSDGVLKAPDGTLAGAHLTLGEAVANAINRCGVAPETALAAATANPAAFLRLPDGVGRLRPGSPANFVALRSDWTPLATFFGGVE